MSEDGGVEGVLGGVGMGEQGGDRWTEQEEEEERGSH